MSPASGWACSFLTVVKMASPGAAKTNNTREILRRLYAREPRFAAPQMIPGCAMDSSLSLLLISLIGVAAFVFGFLAGRQREKQGAGHG
jgi:hypothetical protein